MTMPNAKWQMPNVLGNLGGRGTGPQTTPDHLPLGIWHLALSRARRLADGALAVLLAPACAACRAPLDAPTRGPVCGACWAGIVPITPPVCDACGDPLASWRVISLEHARCPRCRRRGTRVTRTRAVGAYDGPLRDIVHALKYDRRRSIARPLADAMRRRGADVLDGADISVPVPLHPVRRYSRGFNQAEELARGLELPMVRALRRVRSTPPQADLPEARRHANVRGAFRIRRRANVKGLVIVLVDDVSTTGATLDACAAALLEAGAAEVRALTAAKAVSRRP
jgi:ComF family protein